MEIGAKLHDRHGQFAVSTAIKLIAVALAFSVGLSICHVYFTIGGVREKVNESVLAVAAVNVSEFYGGARESDGYARHLSGAGFISSINTDDVVDTLARSCAATGIDADGTIIVGGSYRISDVSTRYVNYGGGILNFTTTLTVTVPLDLGDIEIPIKKTITVRSSYDTKF